MKKIAVNNIIAGLSFAQVSSSSMSRLESADYTNSADGLDDALKCTQIASGNVMVS